MTKTFRELAVDEKLADALEANGITTPFPIQETTLPLALQGADLIGQARTGTGKTLAFGIPLLQRVDPSRDVTQALVIVPTRELCLQVSADLKIGEARGLRIVSVYGGVGYDEQTAALNGGAHIVVGTPGRLLDLMEKRILPLNDITELVLDEADEMLDMGFLPDVERLIAACTNDKRHTMLFSATMPSAIVTLGRRYLTQPTFMRAEAEERFTAPQVIQHFFLVHRMDKPRLLARILQDEGRGGVFVFVRTKHMADRLVSELAELNTPAVAVHGDLRQTMREKNLERFRSGKATVLVCTEVAARGLDISGVSHVVNYDCPDDDKMYLHRIGRTARAGAKGTAITFAEYNEVERLNVIRKAVGAGDNDAVEAFSTSALLTERFTLPDTRPWDKKPAVSNDNDRPKQAAARSKKAPSDTAKPSRQSKESQAKTARPARDTSKRDMQKKDVGATQTDGDTSAKDSSQTTKTVKETVSTDGATRVRTRQRSRAQTRTQTQKSSPSPEASEKSDSNGPARAEKNVADATTTQSDKPAADKPAAVSDTSRKSDEKTPATDTSTKKPAPKQAALSSTRRTQPDNLIALPAKQVDDDPLQQLRGTGVPRSQRRVLVEHLP